MEVLEKAYVVSPYSDDRGTYRHTGVDVLSDTGNFNVRAVAKGKVIEVQNRMEDMFIVNDNSPVELWAGNYVIIEHGNGYISRYNHLEYNSIKCNVGDIVEEGFEFAREGQSGYATGVHLDFEVKLNDNYVDPTEYALGKESLPEYQEAPIGGTEYLNLSPEADTWRVYAMDVQPIVGNECSTLYPSRFGGLSYTIHGYTMDNVAIIETRDYGQVQIYTAHELASITNEPIYGLVK